MKLLLDFSCFVNRVNECMDQLHSPQRKRGLILTKRLNQLAIRRSRCGRSYGVWMRVRCCISCLNVFVYREKIFQMHMCVCVCMYVWMYMSRRLPVDRCAGGGRPRRACMQVWAFGERNESFPQIRFLKIVLFCEVANDRLVMDDDRLTVYW